MIDSKEEYIKMENVESKHWWYVSLHNLTLKTIQKAFKQKDISILDAGCGTGGLLEKLISNNYKFVEGFDISEDAVEIARLKKIDIKLGDLKKYKFHKTLYDVIISNDTMYFFSPDVQKEILAEFHDSLNKNGIIILNLPSFNIFKGIHDRAVGIDKRFNKDAVKKMIDQSKFTVEESIYWPFFLSPIIFLTRFVQKIKLMLNKNYKIKSDIDIPSSFINKFLIELVKFENRFLLKKPFGSSLFLVIKKKK